MGWAADGARVRLTAGATALSSGGVERLDIAPLGGDDTLTLGDITGTGVQEVHPDFAGGSDRLILDGTSHDGFVSTVGTTAGRTSVLGLPAFVDVVNADPASDTLTINGLAGNDRIDGGGTATAFTLVADGGPGNDNLTGGTGVDTLNGGDGDDFADGRRGADVVDLGAGDDVFAMQAGDGRDTLEGRSGTDSARFSGTGAGEQFDVSAAGQRARLSVGGAVAVDAGGVEALSMFSFGGADRMTVNDVSGSGLTLVDISLFDFGVPGGNEDVVRVDGTGGNDTIDSTDLPRPRCGSGPTAGSIMTSCWAVTATTSCPAATARTWCSPVAATTSASAAAATTSCAARKATTSSTAAPATTC